MQYNYPYLEDSIFLKNFILFNRKEQYVRITSLDFNTEEPIGSIEGLVTGGNISVNGKSIIRRTASLSMIATEDNYDILEVENIISINKKISIEVGFTNFTPEYRSYKIIWFPQGTYYIKTPSISRNNSGLNISLTLVDKMAQLDGTVGGVFPAGITLSEMDAYDSEGNRYTDYPTIYTIIQNLVHEYGGESLDRIIINDIPETATRVLKWTSKDNLYLVDENAGGTGYAFRFFLNPPVDATITATYEYGDDIGFENIPFTFPGTLSANAGETVTTILDKIKNTLGNYEYFYDVNGYFIFQQKKNYIYNNATPQSEKDYLEEYIPSKVAFSFDDARLITSFSNNPQFGNIKNDFIVWGVGKNANGNDVPIRYHVAIDEKPKVGNKYLCLVQKDVNGLTIAKKVNIDFTNYGENIPVTFSNDQFNNIKNNPDTYFYYNNGFAKYNKEYDGIDKLIDTNSIKSNIICIETMDWRTELYLSGLYEENYYYAELAAELSKFRNLQGTNTGNFYQYNNQNTFIPIYNDTSLIPEGDFKKNNLQYWLDFLDNNGTGEDISKFSVNNIGRRQKVIVNNKINCLFDNGSPDYVLIPTGEGSEEKIAECVANQQKYVIVSEEIFGFTATGGARNPAIAEIKDLISTHTNYGKSVSISTIPIYYLEPNTRITINDRYSGIQGDFEVNSFNLPLDVNGTSNISCSQVIEKY